MQSAPPAQPGPTTPPTDLAGQVVVLTGATKGIGLGIAHHLAGLGALLVVTGRKPERVERLSAALAAEGYDHLAVPGNVADRDGAFALAEAAVAHFGRIDGLVANAQTFRPITPLLDISVADMDLLFDTGPKGTLWLMQAVHPHMAAQGRGRIVTMGSHMGLTGPPGYGPYAASKEAIRSLTRTAAREWGCDGITVNCVLPASAAHRMPPGDADPERAAAFQAMYRDHPLGRDGDPEDDIAPVVAFLLSDASRYVTGQTIGVDGGGILRA
jgi:3-oxoacyl-[acyl-carrier protein] reductase